MPHELLLCLFAGLLVLLNGFFVAAEFGLVKLRSTRMPSIARQYPWRGRLLSKVHGQLDTYLSACQLGITLTSLGLGWIGEPAVAALLEPLLAAAGVTQPELLEGIAFGVAFFTISYLHIVLGELVPKSLAIRMSERLSLWTAPGLYAFYWLMFPAIWLLNKSANLVLSRLQLEAADHNDAAYSNDELKLILRASRPQDSLNAVEWKVLAQAIDFKTLRVTDLMRPFNEAVVLHAEALFSDNMQTIHTHRYSRYPWLLANGEVAGMLHIKDIFLALSHDPHFTDLASLVREVELVPPQMPAAALFSKLKRGAPHFSVIGLDTNDPMGFITLDNLLSALVGEIDDEFKKSQSAWTRLEDGSLLGKGTLSIQTLERTLGIDIASDEADTIAGLILWKLTALPIEGQRIPFAAFDVVVKKMAGPKILLVRVYPNTAQ